MKLTVLEEAEDDLEEMEPGLQAEIVREIEDLEEEPVPDNAVHVEVEGIETFRLKLQEGDRNSDLNHRVFYEIQDNKIIVRAVYHRDRGYGAEIAGELRERFRSEK